MAPKKLKLTKEEQKAITSLKLLAEKWPETLWLFSSGGCLQVMKYGEDGKPVIASTGAWAGENDPDYSVEIIDIPNAGQY